MTPDKEQLLSDAGDLVSLIDGSFPLEFRRDDRWPALLWAYLARTAALLRSMRLLALSGDLDSIGSLYRTLLETWLHGAYLGLDGRQAMQRLEEETDRQADRINRALGLAVTDRPTSSNLRLSVEEIARRLQDHLGDGFPVAAYDYHYRITSFHDAHGHLGALVPYLDDGEETVRVLPQKSDPESQRAGYHLLAVAISLCAGLANMVRDRTHRPLDSLDGFLSRWNQYEFPTDRGPS